MPSELWPAALPTTVRPAVWAEPDPAALRGLMRHVFEHRSEARAMGGRARAHAIRHFTWDRTVDEVVALLERWREAC